MSELSSCLTWENIKSFANSAFLTSLIGSLTGAFAGAVAAQRIAEKAKDKELLLTQLRNINAAIVTAFSICNTIISFKKQHVRDITTLFQNQKEQFIEHHRKVTSGEIVGELRMQVDLRNLEVPMAPVEILQTLVFERISVTGRPLAVVSTLHQTLESLVSAVAKRNSLIEQFKLVDPNSLPQFHAIYFGLPFGGGHLDLQYSDTVSAISRLTDDAIFFSELITNDLNEYGETVLTRYQKISQDKTQSVSTSDFSPARDTGLMPNTSEYQDWLKGFVKKH